MALQEYLDSSFADQAAAVLEPRMRAAENWGQLKRLLEIRADAAGPDDAEGFLRELIDLRETRLADPTGAFDAAVRLIALVPADAGVCRDLERLTSLLGTYEALADVFARFSFGGDLIPDDNAVAASYTRKLATLQEDRLERYEAARDSLMSVVAEVGPELAVLDALDRLNTKLGDWPALAEVVEQKLSVLEDTGARRETLFRLGSLFEEVIDDPDTAIDTYQRVLAEDEANSRAVDALQRIYRNVGRHQDLAALLEGQLETVEGDGRTPLVFQLAQLYETVLGDPTTALEHYASILEADPESEAVVEAVQTLLNGHGTDPADAEIRGRACDLLEPIYVARDDWQSTVRILFARLKDAEEASTRAEIRIRTARLYETKAEDSGAAFSAYGAAFEERFGDPGILAELLRLAAQLGAWSELANVFRGGLEGPEAADVDDEVRRDMMGRLASLYENQIGDAGDAIAVNRQILADDPSDVGALENLDRLYTYTADMPSLAEILEQRAEMATEPDVQKALLFRLSELFERELGDAARAVDVLDRIRMDVSPGDLAAYEGLARLHTVDANWDALVQVLRDHAEQLEDESEKISLLLKAAMTLEDSLDRPDDAVEVFVQVLNIDEAHGEALRQLDRLYEQLERPIELMEILDRERALAETEDAIARFDLRRGILFASSLGEYAEAVNCFASVLAHDPHDRGARGQLETLIEEDEVRLDAARLLLPLYEGEGAWKALTDTLRMMLAALDEVADQVETLQRIATIEEAHLEDLNAAFEAAAEAYRISGAGAKIEVELERLAARLEDYGRLADLMSEVAPDAGERGAELHAKIAQIADVQLNDAGRAIAQYREVLELDEHNEAAIDALEHLYERSSDYEALVDILEVKLQVTEAVEARRILLNRVARIQEELIEDGTAAIETWRRVLGDNAEDAEALDELERLLASNERHGEVAELYEHRRGLAGSAEEQAELDFRLARVYETQLSDGEQSLALYQRVLEVVPDHSGARAALSALFEDPAAAESAGVEHLAVARVLEPIYRADADYGRLVPVLESIQLAADYDPDEQARALIEIARIQEAELSLPTGALETRGRILGINPHDESNRNDLVRLAEVTDTFDAVAGLLSEAAADTTDPDLKIALFLQLGGVYEDRLRDDQSARSVYTEILTLEPEHEGAIDALVALLTRVGAWEDLVSLYSDLAANAGDPERQKAFLFRACPLLEDVIGDLDRVIETYRKILELDPENADACKALERFYREAGRWSDLAELLRDEIQFAEVDGDRAVLRHQLGVVLESRLNDTAGAVEAWRTVLLDDDPKYGPSLTALERVLVDLGAVDDGEPLRRRVAEILEPIYEERGQWADWVNVMEVQMDFQEDRWVRLETLSRIARVQEDELDEPLQAFQAYGRAFAEDFGNSELQVELDRLAESLEVWRPVAQVYTTGIESMDDVEVAVALWLKVAQIYEVRLEDAETAIAAFVRALELDEYNREALGALERLYSAEGDAEALAGILARMIENASDGVERKALIVRLCGLQEGQLGSPADAIDGYRRVLEDDPEDTAALDALIRLYEETEAWSSLIEMLYEKIELTEDAAAQVELHRHVAAIHETRMSDVHGAVNALRNVLEIDPGHVDALAALERIFEAEGHWGDLVDLLESQGELAGEDVARLDAIELRIGAVMSAHLGQGGEAIQRYADVLERSPENEGARAALEAALDDLDHRGVAARILEEYFADRDAPSSLARVYEVQLLDTSDAIERSTLLKQLAAVRVSQLGDSAGAFNAYGEAFSIDGSDPEVLNALVELAAANGLQERLARLCRDQLMELGEGDALVRVQRVLASVSEEALSDSAGAIEMWSAVAEANPYDADALAALDRLLTAAQDWSALIEVLRRRVDVVEGTESLDLRAKLGRLLEVVEEDLAGAIELHRSVLWDDPSYLSSMEELERLSVNAEHRPAIAEVLDPIYRDAGEWKKLGILLEMRIEVSDDSRERAELWMQAATLRREQLEDVDLAFECMLNAFYETPDDEDIRRQLIDFGAERSAWTQLVDALETVLPRIDDPDLLFNDRMRLAEWSETHLGDSSRALGHYEGAAEIEDSNGKVLSALERLYADHERWAPLAEVLRRKGEGLYDLVEKRQCLHQLGALLGDRLSDLDGAVAVYEELLDIDDSDVDALTALEILHDAREDWYALCDVLERKADSQYEAADLAQTYSRIGDIARRHLNELSRAADAYEKVTELDVEMPEALSALRDIYTSLSDWPQLQETIVRELAVASDDDVRKRLLMELAKVAEDKLGQPDMAMEYYRQLLALTPTNTEIVDALAQLYSDGSRWFDLVEMLREHLEVQRAANDAHAVVSLLVRIARIAEQHLQDADLAIDSLNEVLEYDPNHAGALNVLGGLYERSGEWARAAETLAKSIEHAEGAARAEAHRRLGLLYIGQLDEPEKGRAALEAAVNETGDAEAAAALLDLARGAGDQARIVALLDMRLAAVSGADRVAVLQEIAGIRLELGENDAAIEALDEAYALSDGDLRIAEQLLDAYSSAGRHADAEPILRRIIEQLRKSRRFKELIPYTFRAGVLAEEQGDEDAALQYYRECFEADASYVPNLVRLGKLYFRREEWAQALRIFQTVLLHQMKLDKAGRVDVYYHLARVRLALGETRKAKDMFNRALSLDPSHADAKEHLRNL